MFRKFLFFLFLLIFCFSNSYSAEVNSYEYLKLKVDNEISFGIDFEDNYEISNFNLNSYFFPQTYIGSQNLVDFSSSKNDFKTLNDTGISYLNYSYSQGDLSKFNSIKNQFLVESRVNRPKIQKKIRYPLNYVGSNYLQYLEHGEFIDTNNKIFSQASKLAQGEDDVFIISSKIAKWIREDINYDLSTISDNPNQKSTEVFESKAGVCREITNLYVSMIRSLGIPARVVTGYSYTNSDELVELLDSNWGGHAWAEVLIGNEWVPFDLTYDQYGYVDSSHIVLDKYKFIRSSSVSLSAKGHGFTLRKGSLETDVDFEILEMKEKVLDHGFKLELEGPSDLGFGSYGYIKLKLENEKDYYQSIFLNFALAPEVEALDLREEMFIFRPNEKKEIYFRFKLPEDLDSNFKYTFPFTIYNDFLEEKFEVSSLEENIKIREIALPKNLEEIGKTSSNELKSFCQPRFEGELNFSFCKIRNTNNFEIENLNICSAYECKNLSLKVNELREVKFKAFKREELINYSYGAKTYEIGVDFIEPSLSYTWTINNGILIIDYRINNYYDFLDLEVYIQDLLVRSVSEPREKLILDLPPGENKVKLFVKSQDKVLAVENFDLELQVETRDFVKEEKGIFDLLVDFVNLLVSIFRN